MSMRNVSASIDSARAVGGQSAQTPGGLGARIRLRVFGRIDADDLDGDPMVSSYRSKRLISKCIGVGLLVGLFAATGFVTPRQ